VVVILPFKISASKWKEKELCKSSHKDKKCLRMQCNDIYKNAAGWSLVEVGVSTIEGRSVNHY
jgi:hypothetical protein